MSSQISWKFPQAFWVANGVELLERASFYAVFITFTLYLSNVVGFDDIDAAWLSGFYAAGVYLLPPFTGAFADKMGFRNAMLLAFGLLAIGFFSLGALPYKPTVVPAVILLILGGSFIKGLITGTVAKTSTSDQRARAYSIFYGMVNIGSFSGKSISYPLRLNWGLESIEYFSAALSLLAVIVVFFWYKNISTAGEGKSLQEVWKGLVRVLTNPRLVTLILIVSGFWMIQHQMYATMPKYVIRLVGQEASPEWIANVNPAVVVTFVVIVTQLMRKAMAITSMTIGMLLMPLSALLMASSPTLESLSGTSIALPFGITAHPITIMLIAGIIVQGLAECFISPRYLEFFSKQAPKGEEGLYLGFGHLHSFVANLLGFGLSGYLLTKYCPDPRTLTPDQMATAYTDANFIWYYFLAIGLTSAIALYIYAMVTKRIDEGRSANTPIPNP
ncbi:MAG: MFS transporter [Bacteroidetes bacterium]|nr:MFS transporter [Bacteroidota bacterium]MCW5895782.1 MFS transporter [Bacteroidota bacterium]